jgi:hypothetical protein
MVKLGFFEGNTLEEAREQLETNLLGTYRDVSCGQSRRLRPPAQSQNSPSARWL